MEKRLILFIILSILILLGWSILASKVYHIDNKEVMQKPTSLPLQSEKVSPSEVIFTLSQESGDYIFDTSQAVIKKIIFKNYPSATLTLTNGFFLGDQDFVFNQRDSRQNQASFVYQDLEKKIVKEFLFSNSNYDIMLDIKVENLSSKAIKINLPLILGRLNFVADPEEARFQDVAIATKEKVLHFKPRKEVRVNGFKFVGLRNRYFCAIAEPKGENKFMVGIKKINPQESEISLIPQEFWLSPGQIGEQKFHIYLGPQDLGIINKINPDWSAIVHYGPFDIISQLLLQLLGFLYRLFHNWGLAIIALSVIIYLLLYPLTLKQMCSMKEMQALQPAIEELRKAHKNNPQKLNKEIMELYRQHKINPLGGCLPLLLQIPVFFALYQALMCSIAIKGAKFLWIKDLSQPDRLFSLPFPQPFDAFNLLPILMMFSMVVQQKLSVLTATSSASESQKSMSILLPLLFGFIFYNLPSGLVLYWFMNSGLTLAYQFRVSRLK